MKSQSQSASGWLQDVDSIPIRRITTRVRCAVSIGTRRRLSRGNVSNLPIADATVRIGRAHKTWGVRATVIETRPALFGSLPQPMSTRNGNQTVEFQPPISIAFAPCYIKSQSRWPTEWFYTTSNFAAGPRTIGKSPVYSSKFWIVTDESDRSNDVRHHLATELGIHLPCCRHELSATCVR